MTLTVMDAPESELWYIRKLAIATGPHILLSHGLNLPSRAGRILSTIRPIVMSVTASINLASKNIVPTSAEDIPSTFV